MNEEQELQFVKQVINQKTLFFENVEYNNWIPRQVSKICPVSINYFSKADHTINSKPLTDTLIERIYFFLKSVNIQKNKDSLMWSQRSHDAISQFQIDGEFCIRKVKTILDDPINSCLFNGFHCFLLDNNISYKSKAGLLYLKWLPKLLLNKVIRLSEATEIIPKFNPEEDTQNRCASFWDESSISTILGKLEEQLKISIEFPNPFKNEYGIQTQRGLISARPCDAIYQAFRLNSLNNLFGHKKIVEIGGGLGRTAYYAHKYGIEDYTIVDLPHVVVAQALFIGQTLGEKRVVLPNEEKVQKNNNCIKLTTPDLFFRNNDNYDICLNADSFVEMDFEIAKKYIQKLQKNSKVLLSINQEAYKFRLFDCLKLSDIKNNRLRYPYWMRMGYVEDLIIFKN